eukprot:CAMPEP_0168464128 /NCGR_PEP_ID=MMETSP0228-20121227/55413_1 /TAXON_ID=133427 /ORGANISM="Protoceratium reticulatum, Strain CCCM 535 (=CCMP 1889)" /LENGTH=83 /DNA_ID=CAMNT_0008479609 /DNA_START=12 /DNA_END=260 /DNA_ORIENTATION=-
MARVERRAAVEATRGARRLSLEPVMEALPVEGVLAWKLLEDLAGPDLREADAAHPRAGDGFWQPLELRAHGQWLPELRSGVEP